MSDIIVEDHIPYVSPTERKIYGRGNRKYPWHTMKPNESFAVDTVQEARAAYNSFQSYRRTRATRIRPSWFVSTSRQEDGTYRLWLLDKNRL